jgi:hypothetical protein
MDEIVKKIGAITAKFQTETGKKPTSLYLDNHSYALLLDWCLPASVSLPRNGMNNRYIFGLRVFIVTELHEHISVGVS